jgi:hypothetical protein
MHLTRSALCALVVGGAVSASLVGAGAAPATPGNGAVRVPVGNQPFDLDPADCGFPIHVDVVRDNEYFIHITTLADGTVVLQATGSLVLRFTNTDTGTSIVENVGGPGTLTFGADGSFSFDGQGHSAVFLDPASQATTGEPGVLFTTGHVNFLFDPNGVIQSFSASGGQTDGCALLS